MASADQSKIPTPEFFIDEDVVNGERKQTDETMRLFAEHPQLAIGGLALVTRHPDATESVLALWREHGSEAMDALHKTHESWVKGLDRQVTFDVDTEDAIMASREAKEIKMRPNDPNNTTKMRWVRLSIFAARSRLASHTGPDTDAA